MGTDPKATAIYYAGLDVALPVRESGGKNRGPRIDAIIRAGGGTLGSPYCAYGTSEAFRQSYAYMKLQAPQHLKDLLNSGMVHFPYTGSSQAVKLSYRAMGRLSDDPQALRKWQGAVAGWTDEGDTTHGHVFSVKGRLTDSGGKLTGIITEEYNTSLAGSRDGEGAYSLRRDLMADGKFYPVDRTGKPVGPGHKLWFCDTSTTIGGQWW